MERAAITTASDRAGRLADMAKRYGLLPVVLPCIEVAPAATAVLDRTRTLAAKADWLLVTSARVVVTLWPRGGMPPIPVAAVGSSTAATVEEAGGRVELVGETGASDLAVQLAETVKGRSICFPHGSGADPTTIRVLKEAGAGVSSVTVYETRPIGPERGDVDAVVFGSPSAVAGWLLTRDLEDIVVAAVGETTARAVVDAGHQPEVVPSQPDFDDLMARLAEYMKVRSPA